MARIDDTEQEAQVHDQAREKRKITPVVIVLAAILVACLGGGVAGGLYLVDTYSQIRDVENTQALEPAVPVEGEAVAESIDFAALEARNPDVYSWVYVPGTTVNYPVCQSASDDSYYLTHNANGEETELGAVFTERQFNGEDFNDRVTILYGHNGFGDTMFTGLHNFERSDFFEANDKIYVYVPGHVYTYEIISAYMADDRHLMGLYDFRSDAGFSQFLANIKNPKAIGANTRAVEVDENSKIIVLSTCNTGAWESTGRYLVCGVMTDDQQTS